GAHRAPHSFPTRRSSDLTAAHTAVEVDLVAVLSRALPRNPAAVQTIGKPLVACAQCRSVGGVTLGLAEELRRHEGKLLGTGLGVNGMQHAAIGRDEGHVGV